MVEVGNEENQNIKNRPATTCPDEREMTMASTVDEHDRRSIHQNALPDEGIPFSLNTQEERKREKQRLT